jgi:hypothetical protein
MPYRGFVGERNWNFAINDFDPTDRCDPHRSVAAQGHPKSQSKAN